MKSNFVEKFNQLPANLQENAIKYIDSLLTQKELQRKKKPKLDWAGGLRELRDQYTAIELQKKASVLRAEWTLKPTRQRKAHSEVF